ncbi:FAD-binding protein [Collinsella sp. An2]|uniref:FAD-binding protein n=1 Tax=Collinsella sp. An2 TaxID=1965585 RepID=UPI000B377B42|nr:FAD-binding protein [Collinsella sp. An2]OUP10038.1 hypothetical protein B5F33_02995 [Collinsella sp. An2]
MQRLEQPTVLVIGAGIAGICAAIEAARAGVSVIITAAGTLFSGSSFYPGTWGLGLIAPENSSDEDDLVHTICKVGCGVANEDLVQTFVHDIPAGIAWLERLGVKLKRPANEQSAHEAAFIPCFDHKTRLWRGLVRESMEQTFGREVERLGIRVLEHVELIDLLDDASGAIAGGVLFDRRRERIFLVPSHAVVLAGGGTSGLFERRLTSGDVLGTVHGIAHRHGAKLVNIEFMQMMPGLIAPKRGIVFNEKSFRYAHTTPPISQELLEMRSPYGPFTSRLPSRAVDLVIDAAGENGLPLVYDFPSHDVPEFVRTFSQWLEQERGIRSTDEMHIAMYAHASNGGIVIDGQGFTGVQGLYACGEATGGMHGADRIGGLSSANGLVFGRRAGCAAAKAATARRAGTCDATYPTATSESESAEIEAWIHHRAQSEQPILPISPHVAQDALRRLRATMSAHCMVVRTADGLHEALEDIEGLHADMESHIAQAPSPVDFAASARLSLQLHLAHVMVEAMLERTESRGSHYRADHPEEDPKLARPIIR